MLGEKEKRELLDAMEKAVYGAILGAFVQGLAVHRVSSAHSCADAATDYRESFEGSGENR